MADLSAFRVSASGMSAQRMRLDVIAGNIANAESTRSAEGGPYIRRTVRFAAVYENAVRSGATRIPTAGVQVVGVANDTTPLKRVYDPGHPDADARGYVSKPNVEIVTEMTDMISATRAYEANVTAFNAAKGMFQKALDIGS